MTTTEQRAKELADAIERGYARWEEAGRCDPSCGCVTVYIEREITPIWTAALAACAREAKLEEAKWWEHLVTDALPCPADCMYCARIAALERAVGESK